MILQTKKIYSFPSFVDFKSQCKDLCLNSVEKTSYEMKTQREIPSSAIQESTVFWGQNTNSYVCHWVHEDAIFKWHFKNYVQSTCAQLLQSCPTLCNLQTVAHQAPLSLGFSTEEYWSEFPCPPPGDLPNPWIEPMSLALQANSLLLSHWVCKHSYSIVGWETWASQ